MQIAVLSGREAEAESRNEELQHIIRCAKFAASPAQPESAPSPMRRFSAAASRGIRSVRFSLLQTSRPGDICITLLPQLTSLETLVHRWEEAHQAPGRALVCPQESRGHTEHQARSGGRPLQRPVRVEMPEGRTPPCQPRPLGVVRPSEIPHCFRSMMIRVKVGGKVGGQSSAPVGARPIAISSAAVSPPGRGGC